MQFHLRGNIGKQGVEPSQRPVILSLDGTLPKRRHAAGTAILFACREIKHGLRSATIRKSKSEPESGGVSGFRVAQGNRGKCFKKADIALCPRTKDPPAQGQGRDRRDDGRVTRVWKSHQLTGRRDGEPVHQFRQRLSTSSICRLGNPGCTVDHAGFCHQAGI